jgi:hypothetical protein
VVTAPVGGDVGPGLEPPNARLLAVADPYPPLLPGPLPWRTHTPAEVGRPLLPPVLSVADGQAPVGSPAAPPADDDPTWQPETSWTPYLLRLKHTASPWRALPAYEAAEGETALAGQVLAMDGEPLAGVTLRIDDAIAPTDETGRFLLAGLDAGHQVLEIDGSTVAYPGRTYGRFEAAVELAPDATTVLPFTIWLPRVDTANTVTIPSPTTEEVVVTSPRIPGLEVHLAPGTVIRDRDGNPVTDLSLTVIPQDRPPFPLPEGVYTPVYFTVQPAGATIGPYGARIVYPPKPVQPRPAVCRMPLFSYLPVTAGHRCTRLYAPALLSRLLSSRGQPVPVPAPYPVGVTARARVRSRAGAGDPVARPRGAAESVIICSRTSRPAPAGTGREWGAPHS